MGSLDRRILCIRRTAARAGDREDLALCARFPTGTRSSAQEWINRPRLLSCWFRFSWFFFEIFFAHKLGAFKLSVHDLPRGVEQVRDSGSPCALSLRVSRRVPGGAGARRKGNVRK